MQLSPELVVNCETLPGGASWLARLPDLLEEMRRRWRLTLHDPCDGGEATCSYVVNATRAGGTPAVLKLALPHFEADHEIHGLLFWNGDPTVRVLEHDIAAHTILLERCEPGTTLRTLPEPEQDEVLATLLRRLWREPSPPHPFRPLSSLMKFWIAEIREDRRSPRDPALLEEGLLLFERLPESAPRHVLLATDLHAGNILRAGRDPWLVIDPKPFIGDPAFDATQHLFNCRDRFLADPLGMVRRMADLLELDEERVRLWTFARSAVGPGDRPRASVARALAP